MQSVPEHPSATSLLKFLGMINFYHRCIPNCTKLQQLLISLLSGKSKNSNISLLLLLEDSNNAFRNLKNALYHVTYACPSLNAPISLTFDASDAAIGAVIHKVEHGKILALSFFSCSLTDSQRRYWAHDRKLLSAYTAIKLFRYILEERSFIIYMDHKPFTFTFNKL
ncbi:uncharacterized protein CEXT_412871 [Caerostris extrusa]|uniref:Reverse transcriptase RNase H-like domain-containing protein n=1 Tax=Caerostris extrusa TaxID=172846 RepID=A0AAV4N8C3_CAEEX|nr:uncharacterized protein CEXT_412871 [Caerostris extrusa]